MSEEVLQVQLREGRGTRDAQRLRRSGSIPAVLYGHKEQTVNLSVKSDALDHALRHGVRLVSLQGPVQETAMIVDVQWDTFGIEVLHVDFARVSATELVTTSVQVELRGDAPGSHEGGVVEQPVHEVELELPAAALVDRLPLNINDLHLGQALLASDLPLPAGARLISPADAVLAHCVEPREEAEAEAGGAAEPELIGKKEQEEGE